jgi:hypothetical protein
MTNLYNDKNSIHNNQSIYDSFNDFIFSKDSNVFNKLVSKIQFYNMTKHLHGDIVECGVFKGSGLLVWAKLLLLHEPNTIKKIIGMDFFNPSFVDQIENITDKQTMKQVFERDKKLKYDDISYDGIESKFINAGVCESKYELIVGDVSETSKQIVNERPGFRISILYLDMDLDEPTYAALEAFWDRIVPGGVIVFDEHGYHAWSESNAVDRFVKERGLVLHKTLMKAPTAYIIK